MALLELQWRYHRVHYLDFIVDGRSLNEIIAEQKTDDSHWILTGNIGCLGWGTSEYQQQLCEELLGDRPSELETGRLLLYVCPSCGDVGCQAVTAQMEDLGTEVAWRDFGYEVNYRYEDDDPLFRIEEYAGIGPYVFDRDHYRETLLAWPLRPPPPPAPRVKGVT